MQIDLSWVLACITIIGAVAAMVGFFHKYLAKLERLDKKNEEQDKRIQHRKEDIEILLTSMLACLDGLQQIGANGNVTKASGELGEYIIKSR